MSLRFGNANERPPPVIPEHLAADAPHLAAGILTLDCWIANDDRNNQNIAYTRGGAWPVMAYDHERAFFGQPGRWFYERARGQYADALSREGTPARQRAFKQQNPTQQKFAKTDLAKFENTWDQLPHEVSRGAQKNFVLFMHRLRQRGRFEPDQTYFQYLVAKAILFRRAERLVGAQNFGGYRANIVTYTLALLSNRTAQRVDLDRLWREQDISTPIAEAIVDISHRVYEVAGVRRGASRVRRPEPGSERAWRS